MVNVNDTAAVTAATEKSSEVLVRLDILYYRADIVDCTHAIDMSPEEWRCTLNINTCGTFLCA